MYHRMLKSLYRTGSLKIAASELAKYTLDLVRVKKVRWDDNDSQPTDDFTFYYGNGNFNHHLVTRFFIH